MDGCLSLLLAKTADLSHQRALGGEEGLLMQEASSSAEDSQQLFQLQWELLKKSNSDFSSLVTQALRMAEQKSLQHRMESPGHPKAHLPISAIYPQSLAPKNFQMMFQATYSELTHVPPPQLCCTAKKPIPIWRQQIPEPVLLPTMHSWAQLGLLYSQLNAPR